MGSGAGAMSEEMDGLQRISQPRDVRDRNTPSRPRVRTRPDGAVRTSHQTGLPNENWGFFSRPALLSKGAFTR